MVTILLSRFCLGLYVLAKSLFCIGYHGFNAMFNESSVSKADFMNTRTENRSKNRKPMARCVTKNDNDTSLSC